jgi:hypothetical protein
MAKFSQALTLVRLVENNDCYHRLNKRYELTRRALILAIESGLRFFPKDIYRMSYENELNLSTRDKREEIYAICVKSENESACSSIELYLGRTPLKIAGKRVYVGREFQWKGCKVTCTSFRKLGNGKQYINAVVHKGWTSAPVSIGGMVFDRTPIKRFKLFAEDLKEAKAVPRVKPTPEIRLTPEEQDTFRGSREDDDPLEDDDYGDSSPYDDDDDEGDIENDIGF